MIFKDSGYYMNVLFIESSTPVRIDLSAFLKKIAKNRDLLKIFQNWSFGEF